MFYWRELLKIWEIVCLLRSPGELHRSVSHLIIVIGLNLAGQLVVSAIVMPESSLFFSAALVLLFVPIRCIPFLVMRKNERIVQSLTALFGAEALLNLPLFVGILLIDSSGKSIVLSIMYQVVFTWRLLVGVFVYRMALAINWLNAFLWVVVIYVLYVIMVQFLSLYFG